MTDATFDLDGAVGVAVQGVGGEGGVVGAVVDGVEGLDLMVDLVSGLITQGDMDTLDKAKQIP